jgi:hypothetical protein
MLKFDTFQGSPIIEGMDEYTDKLPNKSDGYSDGTKTYMDAYSDLLANEKMLTQLSTDLIEHMDAQKYCKLINGIVHTASPGVPQNDVSYYIQNAYITGNNGVNIDWKNKDSYLGGTNPCEKIKTWADPTIKGLKPIDTTNIADISRNGINVNFGINVVTDLSYISLLLNKSNTIIKDISNSYPNANHDQLYAQSVNMYNANFRLRKKLDLNMIDLYNGDQSIAMYQRKSMDSVVYANILWTILATSLIYYVFVKI